MEPEEVWNRFLGALVSTPDPSLERLCLEIELPKVHVSPAEHCVGEAPLVQNTITRAFELARRDRSTEVSAAHILRAGLELEPDQVLRFLSLETEMIPRLIVLLE